MKLFITGIGTEIGKTVCSAVLVQYFKADYWKPVQSGDLHYSDSHKIETWTENTICHPETYRLQRAASPHQSAREESIQIDLDHFQVPETENALIVEGAGGLMVPVSDNRFMIDLIETLHLPAALVVRNYLGCINHSLLSIMALQQRNIRLEYLILNGEFPEDTERVICSFIENDTKIIRIPEIPDTDKEQIKIAAKHLTITKL
ncbi:dethiobiotin synthase [Chryseobacterium indologenes]|uniref:dethiobiotin synthase n=1 Tax=Chryseobacterium indologenes TaxID=253 RepID=UPI0003E07820|nr:dethiobiotin synthase [Chryseobacterium indologenes]QPQ51380.1 dethiobiotin synthase [Chryseobacterium indologenes]TLX26957.1 dethiobiotin synthase [Chryseobacterium indologenes]SFI91213.1 dethiobiotin synthetase [Chryseobacterium indologenes]SUX49803.1 ATP-dependent dethiobiotin synthetase BioD [Chryseobacterium indologenes]GAE65307.1 ATP-dependent dethiobiotin synthetase BioD [Chryseobacterium indologenes NBRC 14944]